MRRMRRIRQLGPHPTLIAKVRLALLELTGTQATPLATSTDNRLRATPLPFPFMLPHSSLRSNLPPEAPMKVKGRKWTNTPPLCASSSFRERQAADPTSGSALHAGRVVEKSFSDCGSGASDNVAALPSTISATGQRDVGGACVLETLRPFLQKFAPAERSAG